MSTNLSPATVLSVRLLLQVVLKSEGLSPSACKREYSPCNRVTSLYA